MPYNPEDFKIQSEDVYSDSDNDNNNKKSSIVGQLIKLFWGLVSLFAIFLSFKCNKGFSLGGFLGALIFSPLYVAYKLGTHWDVCWGVVGSNK